MGIGDWMMWNILYVRLESGIICGDSVEIPSWFSSGKRNAQFEETCRTSTKKILQIIGRLPKKNL